MGKLSQKDYILSRVMRDGCIVSEVEKGKMKIPMYVVLHGSEAIYGSLSAINHYLYCFADHAKVIVYNYDVSKSYLKIGK